MKITRKLLALILSLILALAVLPVIPFTASAESEGLFTYKVDGGEATITGLVDRNYSGAIEIPSTIGSYPVTAIGYSAFYICPGLTSVTIPDSVTSIGVEAFFGCTGLESIEVDSGNTVYHAAGNCLIETESKTLIAGCKNSIIPADGSVTTIGYQAFSRCTGLTSVTIPDSVTSIVVEAFFGCTGLKSIIIGNNVTSIDDMAFYYCTGLTSITIPDSVTEIGDMAFEGCTGLTSATIGNSVTCIGGYAFSGCTGLTCVTIPDSVTSIDMYAFENCTGLTSITIPDGLTSTGWGVFCGCKGLTSITIPDSVTSIDGYAFYGCTGLTSVTIPDSVTKIGENAFLGCTGLISVTIPSSVTSLGSRVFLYCTGLTSVTIGNSVKSIGDDAFYYCTGLTSITIPDSVTLIFGGAFAGCTGLTSITIPDSVTSIGDYAFYDCAELTNVYYTGTEQQKEQMSIDSSGNDYLLNATWHYNSTGPGLGEDPETIFTYWVSEEKATVTGLTDESYTGALVIPETLGGYPVTTIYFMAFNGRTGITSVSIPHSVTTICDFAFDGCAGLTSITIPNSVTLIDGGCVFQRCTGIESISVESGNTVYHSAGNCIIETKSKTLVAGCKNSVIPADGSVTSIGDKAFSGCIGLTSITIPDSVTLIDYCAFEYCSGLTSVTIPDTVTAIGEVAFLFCSGLTSITIPVSVASIDDSAFFGCTALTDVYYTGTKQQKEQMSIDSDGNDCLLNATWHYAVCEHANTEVRDAVAATCTEAGYTGDTYCCDCGAKLAEGETIEPLGHDFGEYVSDGNATCTQDGTKTAKCTRCDVTDTVDDEGSMLNHAIGDWMFDEVFHHRHCDMCDEDVDLGEHTYQWVVVIPATVEADGLKKEVCSICGYESGNTEAVPILIYHIPGDIDGDGAVNNKDLTRLFQYLSNWAVEVDEAALDINGDGSVNNKDLARLFQYLSDWDVEIF